MRLAGFLLFVLYTQAIDHSDALIGSLRYGGQLAPQSVQSQNQSSNSFTSVLQRISGVHSGACAQRHQATAETSLKEHSGCQGFITFTDYATHAYNGSTTMAVPALQAKSQAQSAVLWGLRQALVGRSTRQFMVAWTGPTTSTETTDAIAAPAGPQSQPPQPGQQQPHPPGGKGKGKDPWAVAPWQPPSSPWPVETPRPGPAAAGTPMPATEDGRYQELLASLKAAYTIAGQAPPSGVAEILGQLEADGGKSLTKQLHSSTSQLGYAKQNLHQLQKARAAHQQSWQSFVMATVTALEKGQEQFDKRMVDFNQHQGGRGTGQDRRGQEVHSQSQRLGEGRRGSAKGGWYSWRGGLGLGHRASAGYCLLRARRLPAGYEKAADHSADNMCQAAGPRYVYTAPACQGGAAPYLGCSHFVRGLPDQPRDGVSGSDEQPLPKPLPQSDDGLFHFWMADLHSVHEEPDFKSPYLSSLYGNLWHLGISWQDSDFVAVLKCLGTYALDLFGLSNWAGQAAADGASAAVTQSTGARCCMDSFAPVESSVCVIAAASDASASVFPVGFAGEDCPTLEHAGPDRNVYIADNDFVSVQQAAGEGGNLQSSRPGLPVVPVAANQMLSCPSRGSASFCCNYVHTASVSEADGSFEISKPFCAPAPSHSAPSMREVERNHSAVESASTAAGLAVCDVCPPFAAPPTVGVEPHPREVCPLSALHPAHSSSSLEAAPTMSVVQPLSYGIIPEAGPTEVLQGATHQQFGPGTDALTPAPPAAPAMRAVEQSFSATFPCDGVAVPWFQPVPDGVPTRPVKSCFSQRSFAKARHTVSFAQKVDFWFPAATQLTLAQPCGIQSTEAPTKSAGCISDFAVAELPKAKAKIRQSFRLGHTPYEPPPAAPETSGLHAPLSVAGHTLAPVTTHPLLDAEVSCPFSSFDEIQGTRVLAGSAEWRRQDFAREALATSNLPGNPTARLLLHEVASHPSPQVAISQDRGRIFMRAVVIDATLLGGDVETVDIRPGATMIGLVRSLRTVPNPRAIEDYINMGSIICFINSEVVDAHRAISPDADVAHFLFAAPPGTATAISSASAQSGVEALGELPDASAPPPAKSVAATARFCGPRPRTPPVPIRPATPPIPPASANAIVVRRYAALADTGEPFTTFDAIYGHRTFQSAPHSSHEDKLRLAIRASPGLGIGVRHSWLQRVVEGLPSPQLVLQRGEVPDGFWTFPLDLRQCGGHVCVLVADRDASTVEFLARATDTCRLSSHIASFLDSGHFALEVDGAAVTSSASHILRRASVTRLRRTALWSRHLALQRHGATAAVLPGHLSPAAPLASDADSPTGSLISASSSDPVYMDFDQDRFASTGYATLLHVVGLQPMTLPVSSGASVDAVASQAVQAVQGLLPEVSQGRCRWLPCPATPVGEHLFHSMIVPGEPEAQMEAHVILDLRASRTSGPAFHSAVFPALLSTDLLFRLLTNFLGGLRPTCVFQGAHRIEDYLCSLSRGTVLRPAFRFDANSAIASPALWRTCECLAALPCIEHALVQAQHAALPATDSSNDTTSALEGAVGNSSAPAHLLVWEVSTTSTTSEIFHCSAFGGL